jgi:hypothetical protein
MSDDSDDGSDVSSLKNSPSPPQSSRKARVSASSPMLRRKKQLQTTSKPKRSASAMLRAPKPGTILRSQLAHLDDIRWRVLSKFPRPVDLPLNNGTGVMLDENGQPMTPSAGRNGGSTNGIEQNDLGTSVPRTPMRSIQSQLNSAEMKSHTNDNMDPGSSSNRYPPSSPQLGQNQKQPSGVLKRSSSLASGLAKLKRGTTKLRILGTTYENDDKRKK